jgi:hypothetical protein
MKFLIKQCLFLRIWSGFLKPFKIADSIEWSICIVLYDSRDSSFLFVEVITNPFGFVYFLLVFYLNRFNLIHWRCFFQWLIHKTIFSRNRSIQALQSISGSSRNRTTYLKFVIRIGFIACISIKWICCDFC